MRIKIRPPVILAPSNSVSRMIVIAVTDLPEPDSPTSASVSPWLICSETFLTARTGFAASGAKQTSRFSTERMTVSGRVALLLDDLVKLCSPAIFRVLPI